MGFNLELKCLGLGAGAGIYTQTFGFPNLVQSQQIPPSPFAQFAQESSLGHQSQCSIQVHKEQRHECLPDGSWLLLIVAGAKALMVDSGAA